MKKLWLTFVLAGIFSSTAFSYVDLYGIYVKTSDKSFYCAMISTQFCARVGIPTPEPVPPSPWRIICYHPDGTVADDFNVREYTITEDDGGTLVEYLP